MKRGCTQCGDCLNVCPVFRQYKREEYAPRGKRILLEPLEAGTSDLTWAEAAKLSRLCAGCGKCAETCARKLSTADLLADVRAQNPHWTQFLWELWIKRMGPLWPSLGRLADLAPDAVVPEALHSSVITARAMINPPEEKPWSRLHRDREKPFTPEPVVIFAGCTANNVRPAWKKKAAALLKAWGYDLLDDSGFTCCGGTMHHAGQYKAMREMRATNAAHWRALGRPRIAVFCASCHHSLLAYDEEAFGGARESDGARDGRGAPGGDVAAWKAALTPLSALLVNPLAELTGNAPASWGYHKPCHWGPKDPDGPFLRNVLPAPAKSGELCCGMGGILKMTDPDLSMRMAEECLGQFGAGTERIVTGCSGCSLQLAALRTPGYVRHWLDIVV